MEAVKEKFTFFWSGPFSQWHGCLFEIDGVQYKCAEQYMMASKARLFGDTNSLEQILAAKSPREQKALGRKVQGFDPKTWEAQAREIVYQANWAKYTQDPELKA